MTKYNKVVTGVATALGIVAAAGVVTSVKLYSALKAERAANAPIAEERLSKEELDRKVAKEIADEEAGKVAEEIAANRQTLANEGDEAVKYPLEVDSVLYDGQDTIRILLNEQPDMDVVRQYVSVEPLNSGVISFNYEKSYEKGKKLGVWRYWPILSITGDFAFRKDVTLKIRGGFPMSPEVVPDPAHKLECQPLQQDFTFTFQRKDRESVVDFADTGRYLAPIGDRAINIKSINNKKVRAEVREVPNSNIAQMLALEEGEYDKIYKRWSNSSSAKEEFVTDISSEPQSEDYETPCELNIEHKVALPLKYGEGEIKNGIYLVTLMKPGVPRNDYDYYTGTGNNPYRFRVVCISDLALSVRAQENELLVWLNSFTSGKSVADANIEVYSKANILVAKGVTDENGLCRPDRIAAGDAFCVVASLPDSSDRTFMALRDSMKIDETYPEGYRENYLKANETTAFLWTERGIYRHDEKIFLGVIMRNGKGVAPQPFPIDITLKNPNLEPYSKVTLIPDEKGAINYDLFEVPGSQPSGTWTLEATIPNANPEKVVKLGSRKFKVEEFAPPQVRVKAEIAEGQSPQEFSFAVSAEHLYGGPAKGLACEGAVVFEDAPFAPADWKGYKFGSESRELKPNYRVLKKDKLDDSGRHTYYAPLFETTGLPSAMVRVTAQATAFEDGGRPVNARSSALCHFYKYYIGARISDNVKIPEIGYPEIDVACVNPDGTRVIDPKRLEAKLQKIKYIYSYKKDSSGWATWDCEKVKETVVEKISVANLLEGDTVLKLPVRESGDYILTIEDRESNVGFSSSFYLGSYGDDDEIKAPLSQPKAVGISLDKTFYRVGEAPRVMLKAPFAGNALVTLARDRIVYKKVIALENPTCEITLPPVLADWAPSVDLSVSVVQSVKSGANHFAVRAHGESVVVVRPLENEINLKLDSAVKTGCENGGEIAVDVSASSITGDTLHAVVTVVDEGINFLTSETTPDPIGYFAKSRSAAIPFYDLYHRLLPVVGDDILRASGIKTGGGIPLALLSRVSPVATRRFKPLALWQENIELPSDGSAQRVVFKIPDFVGEVRITAVAYSSRATGSTSIQTKVVPKIITQPDAPRFVSPGDEFSVTLPLVNRSGADQDVEFSVSSSGAASLTENAAGSIRLANGETKILAFKAKADSIGESEFAFSVKAADESHLKRIYLPVRPAVNWRESAGVDLLKPGESKVYAPCAGVDRASYSVSASRLAELAAALEWLMEYPHGCLEQTASRIFPLISAGGILNSLSPDVASNRLDFVESGVKRVESMIRYSDFVMWPDCNYAPWDKEVSLYASHFLIEAEKSGVLLNAAAKPRVLGFLKKWAANENDDISAYACHTLALAGAPDKNKMLVLFDKKDSLSALSRARLARAFIATNDRKRAEALVDSCKDPKSVKEAAFLLLAMLELNPQDDRIAPLVMFLEEKRDRAKLEWGTTENNAHALLALGEYYRHIGVREGGVFDCQRTNLADGSVHFVNSGTTDAFISWRRLDLPKIEEMKEEGDTLKITRKFFTPEGEECDLTKLQKGDLVIVELTLSSVQSRAYSDLVIEDLFAGAFEPVHGGFDPSLYSWIAPSACGDWVMRSDARDDRMLVYSKYFQMIDEVRFYYQLRAVSSGKFVLGAASVEAMYDPSLRANTSNAIITVKP